MVAAKPPDLWSLAIGRPQIDPNDLASAIARQASEPDNCYRTRMLIRESAVALQDYWGEPRWSRWLGETSSKSAIANVCNEEFDKIGFPSLRRRMMEKTTVETIRAYLDLLSSRLHSRHRLDIAGSCALILPGYLERQTGDIDVVDEVPKEIREKHQLLRELEDTFGLTLGHVQRHYFPVGWQDRAHWYSTMHQTQIYLVDVYDVFLSKLFSKRIKDMGDLRLLVPQLDKTTLVDRLKNTCQPFLEMEDYRSIASTNWHVLFNESLPS